MKKLIWELQNYFRALYKIVKVLWPLRVAPIIHYHIVGIYGFQNYNVVWEELHKAELTYKRRIRGIEIAKRRARNKNGSFK